MTAVKSMPMKNESMVTWDLWKLAREMASQIANTIRGTPPP